MPPGVPGRARLWLVVVAALCALGVMVWRWVGGDEPVGPPLRGVGSAASGTAAPLPATPLASSPPRPLVPAPAVAAEDTLSAALHEERVSLASGVVVESVETDRPWVCAGETMSLSARIGGVHEPGAVSRWIWPTEGGGAELQPGPALQWRAPAAARRYLVRFQVCKDLGGRRVGVLAERAVAIDVRQCGRGEGQEQEPLRLSVAQRGHGSFAFHALYQGGERVTEYAWSFGDGAATTTVVPSIDHAYPVQGLGPHEIKSFTVKLQARLASGKVLEATAFALTRGQPPVDEPPPVAIDVARWRPRPDGEGWQSNLVVRPQADTRVTWDRFERVTQHWDGRVDVDTRGWQEVIVVEEELEQGGFRGHVTVSPSEAGPDVKQIFDTLYGHDATGKEVVVSWTPFKREPPPMPPGDAGMPPPVK